MSQEKTLIERFGRLRILVAGDFLLDEFVFSDISRVSREAPVLILKYLQSDFRPGGAANTVANVASLGAEAIPLGWLGDDDAARRLLAAWPDALDTSHVFRHHDLATTRKARILAGSFQSFRQQVVRLDYEHPLQLDDHQQARLCQSLEDLVPACDAVILSDYSLGNLSPQVRRTAIKLAQRHGRPVTVDSRDDPGGYPGATTVTPNISELETVLQMRLNHDEKRLENVGRECLQKWQIETLLVTRGRLGLSLIEPHRAAHIPVYGSDEVADVTGAGDTVIAAYTTALAAGASFEQAARLANRAGGIAVTKRGTATVTAEELRDAE